ncbi:MAG: AAA family ATPase [Archaeoglobaceae archaeon]|nr:AAA family ATPase [Archaeoglobaceae archaeon]
MTSIAVTGKGGTGKTLISALLIHFISKKSRRVLAVDADPDSNLADALGVVVEKTLGEVREIFQTSRDEMGTLNKEQWLEGRIYETICECDGFDLLVMGRPEGEGCYCFANSLLRGILRKLTRHYEFIIIDSEAGLEHFSRKTIDSADYVLVVTDMSKKGLATAKRIKELVNELKIEFKDIFLIANRIANEKAEKRIRDFAEKEGMKLLDVLPYDEKVVELDLKGIPIVKLEESSEVYRRMSGVAELFLKRWDFVEKAYS